MTIEGTVDQNFNAVRKAFAANLAEGLDQGAAFAVIADGRVVVDLWGGYEDAAGTRPWRRETIVNLQSTTKGIVALAVAVLVDRGKLDYERPIANYWPAFAAGGKDGITLGMLMSHQAGLNTVRETLAKADLYHGDRFITCLAAMEPIYPPGEKCVYHALSYGFLAAEIVRRVDGRTIGRFIAEEISKPLGASFFLGLPLEQDQRAAEIVAGLAGGWPYLLGTDVGVALLSKQLPADIVKIGEGQGHFMGRLVLANVEWMRAARRLNAESSGWARTASSISRAASGQRSWAACPASLSPWSK